MGKRPLWGKPARERYDGLGTPDFLRRDAVAIPGHPFCSNLSMFQSYKKVTSHRNPYTTAYTIHTQRHTQLHTVIMGISVFFHFFSEKSESP